jgi:hypothetical protein
MKPQTFRLPVFLMDALESVLKIENGLTFWGI